MRGRELRTKSWARTRTRILLRDRGVCGICGKGGATTVDHMVPRCAGGGDGDGNLRAAHLVCNSRKGGRYEGEDVGVRVNLPLSSHSRFS